MNLAFVAMLAGLVFTASCGGGAGSTPAEKASSTTAQNAGSTAAEKVVPAGEWAKGVDDLCLELLRAVQGPQKDLQKIVASQASDEKKMRQGEPVLAEQLDAIVAFREQIEALGTPSEHADDAELIVQKTKGAEDELGNALDALRAMDSQAFYDAMIRYAGFSRQSAKIAQDSELNLAVCGGGA